MSSDLTIGSAYDAYNDFMLAPPLNYSDWNGHQITWRDLPEIRSEVERRIIEIYNSGNPLLAYQLANLYFEQIHPRYEIHLVKSSKPNIYNSGIPLDQYFSEFYDRFVCEQNAVLSEAGLIDPQPQLDPVSAANYPTLWAWQTYCLENGVSLSPPKSHSGGFKEFWDEHKQGIIIAAVVIAVAVTVAIVIVTTVGTGTNVAVATGAAAAQAVIDGYKLSEDCDSNAQNLQLEPQVNEGIQNFSKAIGATDVNNTNGSICVIETDSISETTSEILTGLATDWHMNLASVIEANGSSLLSNNAFTNTLPSENLPSELTTETSDGSTLLQKAKELGSCAVHQILDGAATLVSVVPQALEEIGNIGAKILPESQQLTNFEGEPINPNETYEGTIETLHEWIDELFSTNQAELYTEEWKNAKEQFDVGILPFPSDIRLSVDQFNKIRNVFQLEKQLSEWLGEGSKLVRNNAGDPVFLSKDGLRRVRFDFNKPKPHENPHAHVEFNIGDDRWEGYGQIYPKDVPHK
jgi:hypothetical protein